MKGADPGEKAPRSPRSPHDPAAGPDPAAEYWTITDVAKYWGVKARTVRIYRGRPGALPPEDRMFESIPAWKPETIIRFQRPGQGRRTDLPGPAAPRRRAPGGGER